MNNFLNIQSLSAKVEDKLIINNLNLNVDKGEVHAIMGPNGSGKSTLSNVLAGKDGYEVTSGTINFCGEDLMSLKPNERSNRGIFSLFFNLPTK